MSEIWDQLLALKALTFDTGTFHEAQAFQLKMWSRLMFPHADEAVTKVATGTRWLVEFNVKGSEDMVLPAENLLRGLSESVKDLLGGYFTVKVVFNGTAIFEDKGKPKKKRNLRETMKRLIDADKGADQGE